MSVEQYEISMLQDRHRAILRLRLEGLTPEQISTELQIDRQQVYKVLRSSMGQQHIASLQAAIDERTIETKVELYALQAEATKAFADGLRSDKTSPMQKVSIAKEILNRTGFGPQTKVESTSTSLTLAPEDIERITRRVEDGEVIDVPHFSADHSNILDLEVAMAIKGRLEERTEPMAPPEYEDRLYSTDPAYDPAPYDQPIADNILQLKDI